MPVSFFVDILVAHLFPQLRFISVGGELRVNDGVITGSGTIDADVFCASLCEIDVLQVLNVSLNYTGHMVIKGDLYLQQTALGAGSKKNSGAWDHAILTFGYKYDSAKDITTVSTLHVAGRLLVERVMISMIMTTQATNSTVITGTVTADGGIVFVNLTSLYAHTLNDTRPRINSSLVTLLGDLTWDMPPCQNIHTGRWLANPRSQSPHGLTPAPRTTGPSTGCTPVDSTSLSIVFGGTCSRCSDGLVYSEAAGQCLAPCADSNCGGKGTCVAGPTSNYCDCVVGWTGQSCQLPDCPKVSGLTCNLKGDCLAPTVVGQLGSCSCISGWDIQPDCSVPNNIQAATCGGVTCGPASRGCTTQQTCDCASNWSGSACTIPSCPSNCSSNGVCNGTRTTPFCDCSGGFTGDDCSQNIAGSTGNIIAGLPQTTFILVISAAALAFLLLAALVTVLIVRYNRRAHAAVHPFSERQVTSNDNL